MFLYWKKTDKLQTQEEDFYSAETFDQDIRFGWLHIADYATRGRFIFKIRINETTKEKSAIGLIKAAFFSAQRNKNKDLKRC